MIRELKAWHVLVMMLMFFGVTIGVNSIFVSYALSTFAGEDVSQPYLKGLDFNSSLAARDAQKKLGWSTEISVERGIAKQVTVLLVFKDRDGRPLDALDVSVKFRHPVNAHLDRDVSLVAQGEGRYEATIKDIKSGQWDVVAKTLSTDQVAFQAYRRVVLP